MVSLRPVFAACATLVLTVPAGAVIVLQSTYDREGYGPAEALAAQPQFRATMELSGKEESLASGTWIGNDARHGYILTAAHNFCQNFPPDGYNYVAMDGAVYQANAVTVHTDYNCGKDENEESGREGFDIAIVELSAPVVGVGPPPTLYDGRAEAGQTLTFLGFGMRGAARKGESEPSPEIAAAAQGRIDDVEEVVDPLPRLGTDAGNYFEIYLPREDGSVANPFTGAEGEKPVSRLAGLLGTGDSGGGAWIEIGGRWLLAGVNQSGTGEAQYGDSSDFMRVSPHKAWIADTFPGARFGH